jgi:hypothetical protein
MMRSPPTSPPASSSGPIASPADAERLASQLVEVMDGLIGILQQETALVRGGRLTEASKLASTKADFTRRYVADVGRLRAGGQHLSHLGATRIIALRQRHDAFRAMLQVNLTVLATAHAVSEGIVRGVSGELTRKSVPHTYGASGRTNLPSRSAAVPLAVSRTL